MKRYSIFVLVLFIATFVSAQKKSIAILSVNDMHATIERMPKFAAIVDSLRGIYPDLLIFSAGDNRTGNALNDQHAEPSRPMTQLMNAVGFNASTIGNHEFDSKIDGFRTQLIQSNFPYLCANIEKHDSLRIFTYPYKIFEVDGVKIGVLGIVQTGANNVPDTHPSNVKGMNFPDEIETISKYSWLRDHCDVEILLTHCGYENDTVFARKFPHYDAIIGGHSHTRVGDNQIHNGVLITQAENKLKCATLSVFVVENGKVIEKSSKLINVANYNKENSEIAAMVKEYSNNPELKKVLTQVATPFTKYEELGCMMTDALCAQLKCDVALQNSGGVRYDSLAVGPMTVDDALRLDPFGNEAVLVKLNGKELADLLIDCRRIDELRVAYVSGIKYTITYSKSNPEKVISIKLFDENGKKLDMNKEYVVAMNSYISSMVTFEHRNPFENVYKPCSDLMMDYLRAQKSISYQGITRVTEIAK